MDDIRWGILGTANIARSAFLPALAEAGGGRAVLVGARDADRASAWAADEGIERGVEGYDSVLASDVDAVYIPLPNSLHAYWAAAALRAGKAVLCEKPLSMSVAEVEAVLTVARETSMLLWEAFVFVFAAQTQRIQQLISEQAIGEVTEIRSSFHFLMQRPGNIRESVDLAGGALADVGCYPIRLGRLLFDAEPESCTATSVLGPTGIDRETSGELLFPGGRRLIFECGFNREPTQATVITGTRGSIRLDKPFVPLPDHGIHITRAGEESTEHPTVDLLHFTPAVRHIHAALNGTEAPRHLATDEALGNAIAMAGVVAAAAVV